MRSLQDPEHKAFCEVSYNSSAADGRCYATQAWHFVLIMVIAQAIGLFCMNRADVMMNRVGMEMRAFLSSVVYDEIAREIVTHEVSADA